MLGAFKIVHQDGIIGLKLYLIIKEKTINDAIRRTGLTAVLRTWRSCAMVAGSF